jgi:hypothetical protein
MTRGAGSNRASAKGEVVQSRPPGHQNPDRFAIEPSNREREHPGGGVVQPVHVVDRDQDGSGGEYFQNPQDGERHAARLHPF